MKKSYQQIAYTVPGEAQLLRTALWAGRHRIHNRTLHIMLTATLQCLGACAVISLHHSVGHLTIFYSAVYIRLTNQLRTKKIQNKWKGNNVKQR